MNSVTTSQLPFTPDFIPAFCPNCQEEFQDGDAVVLHLYAQGECGRWLAQHLPNREQQPGVADLEAELNDDVDAGMLSPS